MDNKQQTIMALIGDVGGTNVRLALYKITLGNRDYNPNNAIKNYRAGTTEYPTFTDYMKAFLSDVPAEYFPRLAFIGVAGPVINNKVLLVNTPWPTINGNKIAKELNIENLVLRNDFVALSYGVLGLNDEDLIKVNKAEKEENQIKVVLGPGTGLGLCVMFPIKNKKGGTYYDICSCEVGHAAFAPTNHLQVEYYEYLSRVFTTDHIQIEKAMAGPAIQHIYRFLRMQFPNEERVLEQQLGKGLFNNEFDRFFPNKEVLIAGVNNSDKLCRKVVDFYLDLYSTVIGDAIVGRLPYSGIYLFGNITQSLCGYIMEDPEERILVLYIV